MSSPPVVAAAERERMRERPREPPVMHQVWRHLAFLHWVVEAADVAPLLPRGLDVDTFEGRAYVGVVPFTITGSRPALLPPVPAVSRFHEVNVRTYVHRGGRDPGVWFFSLDAASRLAVAAARAAYKLPYYYARMALVETNGPAGPMLSYSTRRATRSAEPPRLTCSYWPTSTDATPAAPGTLDYFLVERYLLYAADERRRLRSARVFHDPYPLQPAAVNELAETLTAAAGLPHGPEPPSVHYAREVDVQIYRPQLVR
jgi:uncharacterized protein YqjF (DUF2071 family)